MMFTAKPPYSHLVDLSRVVASRHTQHTQASLSVAVRVRPILANEVASAAGRGPAPWRDIIRVLDSKVVVVLDPDESKDYLDQVQNRTKEKRYAFDAAYETSASNADVYERSVKGLVAAVPTGLNCTVFAYGSTGSGKTHTMVGTSSDPGLMVQSLAHIFAVRDETAGSNEDFSVTCSYLEVYNEVIYDLLVRSSGPLELREDPQAGVCVAGLRRIPVNSAEQIMGLLEEGNQRRKTDSTDANATSSRSHAVLEVLVRRVPRNQVRAQTVVGKLTLVDLAGSERAAETNNQGQKLRDGANINRSLLALANCINALGKQQRGVAYVPWRNSKLTRLLKDCLSGNSRTAMVATVSASADQYHHSVNTLKYADRAKEIKTHVVRNLGSVEVHVAEYRTMIDNLQGEVQQLRTRLAERTAAGMSGSAAAPPGVSSSGELSMVARSMSQQASGVGSAEADALSWLDALVQQVNENIEERINLQQALLELEDCLVCQRYELASLDEAAAAGGVGTADARERRAALAEELSENEGAAERYRADIAANEAARRDIQARIDGAADGSSSVAFLKILSTFRIQAVQLQELRFQMAVRDQVIREQRDVISNLWTILNASGLSRDAVQNIARAEGILMQGFPQDATDAAGSNAGGTSSTQAQQQMAGAGVVGAGSTAAAAAAGAVGAGVGHGGLATGLGLAAAAKAGTATIKQSLMAGKARYRYKFWSNYDGENNRGPSPTGLWSQPSLLPLPPPEPPGGAVSAHPGTHAHGEPGWSRDSSPSPSRIPHAPSPPPPPPLPPRLMAASPSLLGRRSPAAATSLQPHPHAAQQCPTAPPAPPAHPERRSRSTPCEARRRAGPSSSRARALEAAAGSCTAAAHAWCEPTPLPVLPLPLAEPHKRLPPPLPPLPPQLMPPPQPLAARGQARQVPATASPLAALQLARQRRWQGSHAWQEQPPVLSLPQQQKQQQLAAVYGVLPGNSDKYARIKCLKQRQQPASAPVSAEPSMVHSEHSAPRGGSGAMAQQHAVARAAGGTGARPAAAQQGAAFRAASGEPGSSGSTHSASRHKSLDMSPSAPSILSCGNGSSGQQHVLPAIVEKPAIAELRRRQLQHLLHSQHEL